MSSSKRAKQSKRFKTRVKHGMKLERSPMGQYVMSWHNQIQRIFTKREEAEHEFDRVTR